MARDTLIDGLEIAATVICPHCHSGYYGPKATNDLPRDGNWLRGDISTAIHLVNGKRRVCRAAKLIPLMLIYPRRSLQR